MASNVGHTSKSLENTSSGFKCRAQFIFLLSTGGPAEPWIPQAESLGSAEPRLKITVLTTTSSHQIQRISTTTLKSNTEHELFEYTMNDQLHWTDDNSLRCSCSSPLESLSDGVRVCSLSARRVSMGFSVLLHRQHTVHCNATQTNQVHYHSSDQKHYSLYIRHGVLVLRPSRDVRKKTASKKIWSGKTKTNSHHAPQSQHPNN